MLVTFSKSVCRTRSLPVFGKTGSPGFCGPFPSIVLGQTAFFLQGTTTVSAANAKHCSFETAQWSFQASELNKRSMRLSQTPVFAGNEYVLGRGWYDPAHDFRYVIATALSPDVRCNGYVQEENESPGWWRNLTGTKARSVIDNAVAFAANAKNLAIVCLMAWTEVLGQRALITCAEESRTTIVVGFADLPGKWDYARLPITTVVDTGTTTVCGAVFGVTGWGPSILVRKRRD